MFALQCLCTNFANTDDSYECVFKFTPYLIKVMFLSQLKADHNMWQWNWDTIGSPLKCSALVFSVIRGLISLLALRYTVTACDNEGMDQNSWHIIVLQVYNLENMWIWTHLL